VSAPCTVCLDELVEPQHLLTPLLLFVRENTWESHCRRRISGRRCRRCPCSVSFPLHRTSGKARFTIMTSHPLDLLSRLETQRTPSDARLQAFSAAPPPPPVRSSTPQLFFFCPPTRAPYHLTCASLPVQEHCRGPFRRHSHRERRCCRWVFPILRRLTATCSHVGSGL
jgi:hypothetical protein